MKKNLLVLISALIFVFLIVGCTNNSNNQKVENNYNYSTIEILEKIKEAMGESYLPNTDIDEIALSERFGIDINDVVEFSAQEPMIGFHPDKAIIIKAKENCAEKIENTLIEAKEKMVSDAMQYPSNIHKTNSAKIVRNGNYVAFLLLGLPDDGSETDEEAIEFAENQVKIAVDAFNDFFK